MYDQTAQAIRRSLNRKALATTRHRAAAARLLDLSDSELLAVQYLALLGRLTPTALGSRLLLTSGGTTALVQRLERAGYVTRESHPADARSTLVALTPKAEKDATEVFMPLVAELDRIAGELTEDEREVVGRYMARVAEAAERHADEVVRAFEQRAHEAIGEPVSGLWT